MECPQLALIKRTICYFYWLKDSHESHIILCFPCSLKSQKEGEEKSIYLGLNICFSNLTNYSHAIMVVWNQYIVMLQCYCLWIYFYNNGIIMLQMLSQNSTILNLSQMNLDSICDYLILTLFHAFSMHSKMWLSCNVLSIILSVTFVLILVWTYMVTINTN
jgi:hypothetical protein